ncbi:MAG: DUF2807 domain-containing protein [Bacteroidales bacterium]|nr:DUF2807 domain-containing protein [Bacteroidales bacterium]
MIKILNILAILMLFASSCQKASVGDCLKSTGSITIEERPITGFHTIELKDNIELELHSSNINSLSIEAGKNLLGGIRTTVVDSVLTIENNNSCNWVRDYDAPLKAYLNFIRLDTIQYRSIGDISSIDTVFVENLVINVWEGAGNISFVVNARMLFCNLHYGTVDFKMIGRSENCFVYSASFGLVDNLQLISKNVYLKTKSSNDVYVNATHTMDVSLEGIGHVYYKGSPPDISLNKTGSGELIRLPE